MKARLLVAPPNVCESESKLWKPSEIFHRCGGISALLTFLLGFSLTPASLTSCASTPLQHACRHVACPSPPACICRACAHCRLTQPGGRVSRGTCQKVVALVSSAKEDEGCAGDGNQPRLQRKGKRGRRKSLRNRGRRANLIWG